MTYEDFTPNERNCLRFLLIQANAELEDESYMLTKGIERGTVTDVTEAQGELKNVTYKLRTVRELMEKLGPFESKAPRIPDLPGGGHVDQTHSYGV